MSSPNFSFKIQNWRTHYQNWTRFIGQNFKVLEK